MEGFKLMMNSWLLAKEDKSTNVPKIACFGIGKALRLELGSTFALDFLVDYMYFIFSLYRP